VSRTCDLLRFQHLGPADRVRALTCLLGDIESVVARVEQIPYNGLRLRKHFEHCLGEYEDDRQPVFAAWRRRLMAGVMAQRPETSGGGNPERDPTIN
jgi:hypothetical protein